jgi:iron complex outermembrane receptor protein
MNSKTPSRPLLPRLCLSAGVVLSPPAISPAIAIGALASLATVSAHAQQAATGTIEGRVINAANSNYLSKAEVSVQGTNIQTLTNDFGEYQLRNVPAGPATIVVKFTGQQTVVTTVNVEGGKVAQQDVSMGAEAQTSSDGEAFVLSEYVVESRRYRTAQEIAINEERNSTNIKNVVATDSLGFVADGNIAEFVKFLPGIDVDYGGTYVNPNDATGIGVRGFGPEDTSIMIDGMPVSSASPASLTRAIGMDMLSINNASRIEVIKVATPDMANNSPGGAINLVTRSAFEYARPTYNVDLTITGNTNDTKVFEKSPGPATESTYHTLPGARVSVAIPLSKTLGFSASISSDNRYSSAETFNGRWRMTPGAVNLTPIGGTSGTPVANADGPVNLSNPYLDRVQINDSPWNTFKQSGNIKFDWRALPSLTLNANIQHSRYTGINVDRRLQFQIGNSGSQGAQNWGEDFVQTFQRVGSFNPSNSSTQMTITSRDKEGETTSGYLKAAFQKGPWTIDASGSHSESYGHFEDMNNGHFSGLDLNLQTGRIDFYGIKEAIPSAIAVWNNSAQSIDYTKLQNFTTDSTLNAQSGAAFQRDIQKDYKLNVRYQLDFMPFPTAVKVGAARSVKDARKWGRGTGYRMRYTGPTLSVNQLKDDYTSGPIFGIAGNQEWASTYKLYDIYEANPEFFDPDFDVGLSIGNYNSRISQTRSIAETTDSGYAMIDASFFNNRVKLITGVRQSRKKLEGYQGYVDSKFNYVRLPNGMVYTDSIYTQGVKYDGSTGPISTGGNYARDAVIADTALRGRMQAAGAIIPGQLELAPNGTSNGTASNNLRLAQERYKTRTLDLKRTDPETPQVQVAYEITDSLQLKLAWSRETKLQNLESGSRGGILTGGNSLNINENLNYAGELGGQGTIAISNANLQPELTNSWNAEVSYYSKSGGKISVSYFYKDIKNLWDEEEVYNNSPEYASILGAYGLTPADFPNWRLTSTINSAAKAKRTGVELSINQNLGFMGRWAAPFDMFLTYSHRPNAAGDMPTNPARGYLNKMPSMDKYSGGLSYSIARFSLQARATYTESGITRAGTVSYTAPGESTASSYQLYNMIPSELRLNLQADYRFSKRYSVFLKADNVLRSHTYNKISDVVTNILPDYAHHIRHGRYGVAVTAGVSASF